MMIYVVALVIAVIPGLLGFNIEFQYYTGLIGVVVGVSGAIFTIMGIWIANIYPVLTISLKEPKVLARDFSPGKEDSRKLQSIVGVICMSAFSMAVAIVLFVFVSMYEGFDFSVQELLLFFIQPAMLMVAITQVFAIASVIQVCVGFVNVVRRETGKVEHDKDA